jgi:FixJ family two-component response regulator
MNAAFSATARLVVVVDDDQALLSALRLRLELEVLSVAAFATAEQALAASPSASRFVIDLKLPGVSGRQYLAEVRRRGQSAPAILSTGQPLCGAHANRRLGDANPRKTHCWMTDWR